MLFGKDVRSILASSLALVFIELKVELHCASAALFRDSKGTVNRRSQKVQIPLAGIVPSHLTTLKLRFGTANFSSVGWLRVPPSPEGLASPRYVLRVSEPYSLRGAGGVAAGLAASLSCLSLPQAGQRRYSPALRSQQSREFQSNPCFPPTEVVNHSRTNAVDIWPVHLGVSTDS